MSEKPEVKPGQLWKWHGHLIIVYTAKELLGNIIVRDMNNRPFRKGAYTGEDIKQRLFDNGKYICDLHEILTDLHSSGELDEH